MTAPGTPQLDPAAITVRPVLPREVTEGDSLLVVGFPRGDSRSHTCRRVRAVHLAQGHRHYIFDLAPTATGFGGQETVFHKDTVLRVEVSRA
jgi:hypothetical protein